MARIKNETLEKAMLTICKWAKQHNVDYVSLSWFEPDELDHDYIDLTYTVKGTEERQEDGLIRSDYYKSIRIKGAN